MCSLEKQLFDNIDIIFNDLVEVNILPSKCKYFSETKKKISRTYLQHFQPLAEFISYFSNSNYSQFYLHNAYLYASAFFLDRHLDSKGLDNVRKVKLVQASSYLLLRYLEEMKEKHNPELTKAFYRYYSEQTDYLIREKEWVNPEIYLSRYLSEMGIYKKAIILLFPVYLCSADLNLNNNALESLFQNYFSYDLLADDLTDIERDLNDQCISYPLGIYYQINGKWPQDVKEMNMLYPKFRTLLNKYKNHIYNIERSIGWRSEIIDRKFDVLLNLDKLYH